MLQVMELRKNLYKFLSQMYLMEVDTDLLMQLKNIQFPEDTGNENLDTGYALFSKYLWSVDADGLDELAADYAKTFLAAGAAQGSAAFPYESVYTSRRKLVGQEAQADVAQIYREQGLKLGELVYKIPEDHISVELEFMSYLCGEWENAAEDMRAANIDAQKAFFRTHLNNWVLMFCTDIERLAGTDFYRGLAKITKGFIQEEKVLFGRI